MTTQQIPLWEMVKGFPPLSLGLTTLQGSRVPRGWVPCSHHVLEQQCPCPQCPGWLGGSGTRWHPDTSFSEEEEGTQPPVKNGVGKGVLSIFPTPGPTQSTTQPRAAHPHLPARGGLLHPAGLLGGGGNLSRRTLHGRADAESTRGCTASSSPRLSRL